MAALGAALGGWLVGAAVVIAFETLLVAGPVNSEADLFFILFLGLFAGLGWAVSVLPLAMFGNHEHWFFSPRAAPLVGAACGVLLLALELRVFFGEAPWPFRGGAVDPQAVYPLTVAGIVGATTWSLYTWLVRWWRNEEWEPEP